MERGANHACSRKLGAPEPKKKKEKKKEITPTSLRYKEMKVIPKVHKNDNHLPKVCGKYRNMMKSLFCVGVTLILWTNLPLVK